ncbi:hypothetical protein [Hymenobacter sp. UYCo722]|uniref:hypothetical protein n=1 Tax=Hymenobacter sp. UYCo722 TaxID=3156335 RepID=UPI00339B9DAE
MLPETTEDEWLLAYTMSCISERCYYAGWYDGLEYVLWNALTAGPRRFGHDEISSDDITALEMLKSRSQRWIFFDDSTEETVISIEKWELKYTDFVRNNPAILKR